MAKRKRNGSDAVDRAAEAVGHALGTVVGTIESLQAQHPHPVDEAREALAAGQERVAAVASQTGTRASAMIKKAKVLARRPEKAKARARGKGTGAMARATRTVRKTVRKIVKRARKAVKTGRKTVGRAQSRRKR